MEGLEGRRLVARAQHRADIFAGRLRLSHAQVKEMCPDIRTSEEVAPAELQALLDLLGRMQDEGHPGLDVGGGSTTIGLGLLSSILSPALSSSRLESLVRGAC
jgi:hypothetical protein